MAGFDQLHPAVQHHVVNTLGWPGLRPLQSDAIGPILAGEHVLALAPTAGGKTEAAVLPLLSQIATEGWRFFMSAPFGPSSTTSILASSDTPSSSASELASGTEILGPEPGTESSLSHPRSCSRHRSLWKPS